MYDAHYIAVNILLMAWIAFNITFLLDMVVMKYQVKWYLKNTPRHLWSKNFPRDTFLFLVNLDYGLFWILILPSLVTVFILKTLRLLIAAFDAAIRAFWETMTAIH